MKSPFTNFCSTGDVKYVLRVFVNEICEISYIPEHYVIPLINVTATACTSRHKQ